MHDMRTTWGSHVPTNQALIDYLGVTGVLEIGAGLNSTPMFARHVEHCVSIETDKEWVDRMRAEIGPVRSLDLVHYDLQDQTIQRATRRVSQEVEDRFVGFCKSKTLPEMNMLFVDGISSLRYASVMQLTRFFDVVTFHDYQDKGKKNHYRGGIPEIENYDLYVDQTFEAHTGILIASDLEFDLDQFREFHAKRLAEFYPGATSKVALVPW